MTGSVLSARSPFKPILLFTALAALVLLPSCMSLAGRDYEIIPIETDPPGAEAVSVEGERCTTPCSLRLPKMSAQAVWVEMPGFEPVEVALSTRAWPAGIAGSIAGNLLLGTAVAAAGVAYAHNAGDLDNDGLDDPWGGLWLGGAGIVIAIGGGVAADFSEGVHRKIEPRRVRVVLAPAIGSKEPPRHVPGLGALPNRN